MIQNYLNEIISVCSQIFGVSVEDITSSSQKEEVTDCRKAITLLCVELGLSYKIISTKINRTPAAINYYLSAQPKSRYYKICLKSIREKLEFLKTN